MRNFEFSRSVVLNQTATAGFEKLVSGFNTSHVTGIDRLARRQIVARPEINLHGNTFIKPRWNFSEPAPIANTIGQLGMHEFVCNDIDALTFWANNDACSATDKARAAVRIEAQRPECFCILEKNHDGRGSRGAKPCLDSLSCVGYQLLNFAAILRGSLWLDKRLVRQRLEFANANKSACSCPGNSEYKRGHSKANN